MNNLDSILLLLGVLLALRLFTKKLSSNPLPPGPRGLPFIGSVLDIPMSYQWLTFAKWAEKWGKKILLGGRMLSPRLT